ALHDADPVARALIESRPPVSLLRAASGDADRFAELARSSDVDRLNASLGLWRGYAYADVADVYFARADAVRFAELRIDVLALR
ncbi:hypothetical protein C7C45_33240, partial [Micromonospora arborensis]